MTQIATPLYSSDGHHGRLIVDAHTLALFHFDEGMGTSVVDETGVYTATFVGGVTWKQGDGGNFGFLYPPQGFSNGSAAKTNGSSGYITIPSLLATPPANGTLEFWWTPAVAPPQYATLFSLYTIDVISGSAKYDAIGVYWPELDGPMLFYAYIGGTMTSLTGLTSNWPTGVPVHLAFTWGARGLELWINGVLEASATGTTTIFAAGTDRPFTLGVQNQGGTQAGFLNATYDELRVSSVQRSLEEIRASMQQRRLPPVQSEQSKWGAYSTVLTQSQAWEIPAGSSSHAVYEPAVVYLPNGTPWQDTDGSLAFFYSAGWSATLAALGLATAPSSAPLTWTKYASNPVIGQGAGGQSGFAARSFAMYYNGTFYVWAADAVTTGNIWLYKSTSKYGPFTKSAEPVLSTGAATWMQNLGNTSVFQDPDSGLFWMLSEWSGSTGPWHIGLFGPATTPDGPWPAYAFNPLYSLQVGNGPYGGPSFAHKRNGVFNLWHHYGISANNTFPNHITRSTSVDLVNWTPYAYAPVMTISPADIAGTYNQVADPKTIFELNQVCYFVFDKDANASGATTIIGCSYAAPMTRLLQDSIDQLPPHAAVGASRAYGRSQLIGTDQGDSPNAIALQTLAATALPSAAPGGAGGLAEVGSNMGSVASVTGNVGGSVGSVTGAVGSVTGSVGGDVAGKVLGGGSSAIAGIGAQADLRAIEGTGVIGATAFNFDSLASNVQTIESDVAAVQTACGTIETQTTSSAIAAAAQTGLTAQGYTAPRAGYLDVLDGLVAALLKNVGNPLATDSLGRVTAVPLFLGTGSIAWPITIQLASGDPVGNVSVWVSSDAEGQTIVAGPASTDANGRVIFSLDPGEYYRWAAGAGCTFDNPQTFTVASS